MINMKESKKNGKKNEEVTDTEEVEAQRERAWEERSHVGFLQ